MVRAGWSFGSQLVFGIAGAICLLNFYLSFVRYPLHKLRGGEPGAFRWSSGVPLLGSLVVGGALLFVAMPVWAFVAGTGLALIDTGGIHWFIGTLVWQRLRTRS